MLNFFISYYSNRRQYVRINGKTSSDYLIIPRSVLQGTILGVIGFLIFINDLPNATRHAFNKIFADDLNSIFIANSHDELLQQVNSDIERLFVYYSTNKLSIHPQKSTVILFNNSIGLSQIMYFKHESCNIKSHRFTNWKDFVLLEQWC